MREQRLEADWARELEAVAARIGALVPRPESRDRLERFMRVTMAADARRNGWQLAEAVAEATPHGMQRLAASAASWGVEGVRDDLRTYVVHALGTKDSTEEGHEVDGCAAPVQRHGRARGELPNPGVPRLCDRPGTHVHGPRAVRARVVARGSAALSEGWDS